VELPNGTVVPIQGWSLVPLLLSFVGENGQSLAKGTGFCWSEGDQLYLVSTRHCMSGRRTDADRQPLDINSRLPVKVQVALPKERVGAWLEQEFDLCDEAGEPKWLMHPNKNILVDVAMLPILPMGEELRPRTPTEKETVRDMRLAPSLEVFILGYPLGLRVAELFAIWKRATVATEPNIDPEGLPIIYVDGSPTRGMSGSPVIAHAHDLYTRESDGHQISFGRPSTQFIGIYSGRRVGTVVRDPRSEESVLDAQLGIVWKRRVLDEIAQASVRGDDFHR
jgi:hypothetical protein